MSPGPVKEEFSSGQELANLAVSSGLLQLAWEKISELSRDFNQSEPIRFRVHPESKFTVIAFVTSPTLTKELLQEEELVPSASVPFFHFLCSKRSSSFSINKAAVTLFDSLHDQLSQLKTQFGNKTPLIITGHSLGGSVASLFTLWLLEGVNQPDAKRPLCITFGAPLIGDKHLQEAISRSSLWNSCFLHVASNQDSVPRLFISPHNPDAMEIDSQGGAYEPFGTFLLCSESGYTCFEDPEAVSELLKTTRAESAGIGNPNVGCQILDYGEVVKHLMSKVIIRGNSQLGELTVDTLQAGIIVQLEAVGVLRMLQNSGNKKLIANMARMEKNSPLRKKKTRDPSKKLNEMKIYMAKLEWYKKKCSSEKTGYYDSYKNKGPSRKDIDVGKFKIHLNIYWENIVKEAETTPQTEEATLRDGWLYGGTNYRRMVEPLDIADYYKKGSRDYLTKGRSEHYTKLEQWFNQSESKKQNRSIIIMDSKKQNVSNMLTEDSCFWAHVEEALIQCESLKSGVEGESTRNKLREFEEYVLHQIKNYAVSPEIFLEESSFMKWWKDYKEIMGISYSSQLTDFMTVSRFLQYAEGSLVLS